MGPDKEGERTGRGTGSGFLEEDGDDPREQEAEWWRGGLLWIGSAVFRIALTSIKTVT